MAFLRKSDYYNQIKEADLDIITDSTDSLLPVQEVRGVEELSSYIRHRYEVEKVFKNILTYSNAAQYNIGDLVEWSETAYNVANTYNTDDLVSYLGYIYEADEDGITGVWDGGKWTQLVENESLHYCKIASLGNIPSNTFAYTTNLYTSSNDQIKGWDRETDTLYFLRNENEVRIFTSEADRTNNENYVGYFEYEIDSIDPPYLIEINEGNNVTTALGGFIEIIGYIPDETEWSVAASNYWTSGDNRNPKIIELLIDINLYHLQTRSQYRNIPEWVVQRYDGGTERQTAGAIGYLKMVQKGDIDMDLPRHNDNNRGQQMTIKSNDKLNYNY